MFVRTGALFVMTMFICFVVWMGNKTLYLPPITASTCELRKTRRNSQASSLANKCLQVWIQAHKPSE